MKVRDSGMPERTYWESLFDIPLILQRMEIQANIDRLVEFGCGYGTFTIPVAKKIKGKMFAFDLDSAMIELVEKRKTLDHLQNLIVNKRDFISEGTGIKRQTVDYVMIFNILHHDKPQEILGEAYRILKVGGKAGIMHWNYDAKTPRGPRMDIRPRPDDMQGWAETAGFVLEKPALIDLPPYHYGFIANKT